jgi:hypothetical protein
MRGFVHSYETAADAAAREKATEMAQLLKELEEWQRVIVVNLGVMIRGGANRASLQQLEDATAEYGERFRAITDYASVYRLGRPSR